MGQGLAKGWQGGRLDKLRLMETYVLVVRGGSFTAAAEKLRVSRAVVTKHIALLERFLGSRLLNRTTRRLEPTNIGRHYFDFCCLALQQMEEAEAEVVRLQNEPRGALRLAVPKAFGSLYGGAIASDFLAAYPDIEISTIISDSPIDHAQMFENAFDLAIRLSRPQDPLLVTRQVCRFRWIVCASPAYIARHGAPKTPGDLSAMNCLIHNRLAADGLWRLSSGRRKLPVKVRGNFSSNSALILRDGALAGKGVALLPAYCISGDLEQKSLMRLLPAYDGPEEGLFIVFPSSQQVPVKVRLFVDFIVKRFRTPPWISKAGLETA